jgi:hypothetical protein
MSLELNRQNAFVDQTSLESFPSRSSTLESAEIPTSKDITGIEVRLSKALIKDNGTPEVWPFPGLARFYLMTIVVSDVQNGAVGLDLKGFAKVGDNEELPVDRTLFYWKKEGEGKSPSQIHVFASILKSKEDLRDVGKILSEIKGDAQYKDLVQQAAGMIGAATPVGAIADTLFTVATILGKYLGKVKDNPWLTWVQSFTDLNGDLDNLGITLRGRENENAAMSLSLIIRDKGREEEALKLLTPAQREALG